MDSVEQTQDSGPSVAEHIPAVHRARLVASGIIEDPDMGDVLSGLLAAYDALGARLAWLAALHAEAMQS